MTTTVVNLRRSAFDVYIGRVGHGYDGYFGNPYRIGQHGARDKVLELYRAWFLRRVETNIGFRQRILGLRGARLGCFCAPLACHGDIIAAWVDAQPAADAESGQ